MIDKTKKKLAVIGTGISGLSAAWLLSKSREVEIFEENERIGGHCNTVEVELEGPKGKKIFNVDTGFIVYNEKNYRNLVELFNHLGVETEASNMSFSVSLENGNFEYSGSGITGLLAQKKNIFRPRFWQMIKEIIRFYRSCTNHSKLIENEPLDLKNYLLKYGYGNAFMRDHIYPLAGSIWSASQKEIENYPFKAFARFLENHGLLEIRRNMRPKWRTVSRGSSSYINKIIANLKNNIITGKKITSIIRSDDNVVLNTDDGNSFKFDQVIIGTHSDQALSMLKDSSDIESTLLSKIRYEENKVILHTDTSFMPKNKNAWASWNYINNSKPKANNKVCLTYWMNSLQNIDKEYPIFVTVNPEVSPVENKIIETFYYSHPIFDKEAIRAQKKLWSLQGKNRTWYCGAYFGYGFHEDGVQSGLAVAEMLGDNKRPWTVPNESDRLCI